MKKFLFLLVVLIFFGLAEKYHLMDGVDGNLSASVNYNPRSDVIRIEANIKPIKEVIKNFLEKGLSDDVVGNDDTLAVKKINTKKSSK